MASHVPTTAAIAVALAVLHAEAKRFDLSSVVPRSGWLSLGGGVSVAYVFVHVLPELGEGQEAIREVSHALVSTLSHHAYLIALFGFTLFHGLEQATRKSKRGGGSSDAVFWVHMSSYGLLNAVIGYLLLEYAEGGHSLAVFAVAMGFHFLINDDSLRRHHSAAYDRRGRWVLAAAVLLGWATAVAVAVDRAALMAAFAFAAGSVILNVIKEELPTDRESNFWAFLVGAAAYATLLLAI